MRNGYKVYDSDTHIRPRADTLEKYLSARVRELVPDLESRKVSHRRHSTGLEYTPRLPEDFPPQERRLRRRLGRGCAAHAGRGGAARHNARGLWPIYGEQVSAPV